MERVIIGVDPRKLPVTIEARDGREVLRAIGWFETSYRGLSRAAEGSPAHGRPHRLIAYTVSRAFPGLRSCGCGSVAAPAPRREPRSRR